MPKRLNFTGYSDDTFACSGSGIDVDYDNCANGKPIVLRLRERSGVGEMFVVGQYAPGPCGGWLIGVAPGDDERTPDWPMHYEPNPEVGYSPRLVIEAPDDVEVTHVC